MSDLANSSERRFSVYLPEFMQRLNKVLSSNEYEPNTKLHAIIAVGDVCLATEEDFQPFLDDTMASLNKAASMTAKSVNEEDID